MSLDLCITDGIPTECFVEVFYSALLIKMEFAHTLLEMSPFEEQAHALWHIHCTAISPNKLQTEWALCCPGSVLPNSHPSLPASSWSSTQSAGSCSVEPLQEECYSKRWEMAGQRLGR